MVDGQTLCNVGTMYTIACFCGNTIQSLSVSIFFLLILKNYSFAQLAINLRLLSSKKEDFGEFN